MFSRFISAVFVRFRRIMYKLLLMKCGKHLVVDSNVVITYPKNLVVGDNVTLNKRVFIQCHSAAPVYLGNGVVMSYDSMILTAGSPLEFNPSEHIRKSVVVGDNVRILAKSVITCGVELGRGCIIGAGAVVRNNVPPYAVVAGNPAKIVGFLSNPEDVMKYEEDHYLETNRTPREVLESNYDKYFLNRIKIIREYCKL